MAATAAFGASLIFHVLSGKIADGRLKTPFDLIVHSTGVLVARTWLSGHYTGAAPETMPVQRLVMIAPANFGSRLATIGQTILGRIAKGWGHGFHTGKLMLDALELGSPFQWGLASRDHASITDPTVAGDGESQREHQDFRSALLGALACPSFDGYRKL